MNVAVQLDLFNENPLTPSGLPDRAFFLCNITENRRGDFGVLYCGNDIFKNYNAVGLYRETRYLFISGCTEQDAQRIADIMNSQYDPPHPEGEYSVIPLWRAEYLMSGHKDENGRIRTEQHL